MSGYKQTTQGTHSKARIGVIIPLFNDIRVIHSIESVIKRDPHRLTRIYVIDGGSKEELISLVQRHLRPGDYFKSERDKGIFDALNKGLNLVEEEFVGWIGSDDFFTGTVDFRGVAASFDHEDIDCYVYDLLFINGEQACRITRATAPTLANIYRGRHVQHFSSFWRKSRIGDLRFDLRFPIASDQDFFCKMSYPNAAKAKLDHRVSTVARLGGNSTRGLKRILEANLEVYRIFKQYMPSPAAAIATVCKMLRKLHSVTFPPRYRIVEEMTDLIVKF